MHAEDFFVNKCTNWQTVEDIRKDFPEFNRVAAFALIIKAINTINLRALVVASQQEEILGVLDLVTEK